jgi:uncharacterized phage protein gp47/JayE
VADLNTKTHAELVEGQAATIQARAAGLVDFSVGAIMRAAAESVGGVGLWLEALILKVLALTRASTSEAADLDSFVADFGAARAPDEPAAIERLGPTYATGSVTLGRLSAVGMNVVAFGGRVQTADGAQTYIITPDPTNPAYGADVGGYVMLDGISTVSVPVVAVVGGAAGNAVAGTVTVINGAMPGIDTVTNPAAFTNGQDGERDEDFRIRFRGFIQNLREGTPPACGFAVASLQVGVTCKIVENLNHDGSPNKGFFYAVVDDGSGSPPSSLLTAASLAIDEKRAITSEFGVYAPAILTTNVTFNVSVGAGANEPAAIAASKAAVTAYLNSRAVAEALSWSRLHQIAYDASPDITDITGLLVNGGTSDLAPTVNQVIKAGTVVVT